MQPSTPTFDRKDYPSHLLNAIDFDSVDFLDDEFENYSQIERDSEFGSETSLKVSPDSSGDHAVRTMDTRLSNSTIASAASNSAPLVFLINVLEAIWPQNSTCIPVRWYGRRTEVFVVALLALVVILGVSRGGGILIQGLQIVSRALEMTFQCLGFI